jgi:hypothetical protein
MGVALILLSCSKPTDSIVDTNPLEASITANGIVYTLSIPRTDFQLTDTLRGEFRVTNVSSSERTFNFYNIQQHCYRLTDESGNIALFYPTIVSPALSSLRLWPSETHTYSIYTAFQNHEGEYVQPGAYHLSAYLLDGDYPKPNLRIRVNQ